MSGFVHLQPSCEFASSFTLVFCRIGLSSYMINCILMVLDNFGFVNNYVLVFAGWGFQSS